MPTIKLKGEIDIDLTRLGLKKDSIVKDAMLCKTNKAMYFTIGTHQCVVYHENYEIITNKKL